MPFKYNYLLSALIFYFHWVEIKNQSKQRLALFDTLFILAIGSPK